MITVVDIREPHGKRFAAGGRRRADVVRLPNSYWDVYFFEDGVRVTVESRRELADALPLETATMVASQWVRDEPGVDLSWSREALMEPWKVRP